MTFHPAVGGEVKALVATSSMVIAGGGFTTVAGKTPAADRRVLPRRRAAVLPRPHQW